MVREGTYAGGKAVSRVQRDFVRQCIASGVRADGRKHYDLRSLRISLPAPGVAEVSLGQTKAMCSVKFTVKQPRADRPMEGFYRFHTELSPLAAASFEGAFPAEERLEIGRAVEKALKDSRALDTEGLCIVSGEKVWDVSCRLTVLDHEGNLITACGIAAVTALKHARRPAVSVDAKNRESITIYHPSERPPVPLAIHHLPLPICCIFFANSSSDDVDILVDPTLEEELSADGHIVVTANAQGELCGVDKAGSPGIGIDSLIECTRIAAVKANEATKMITNVLAGKPAGSGLKPSVIAERITEASVSRDNMHLLPETKGMKSDEHAVTLDENTDGMFSGGRSAWSDDEADGSIIDDTNKSSSLGSADGMVDTSMAVDAQDEVDAGVGMGEKEREEEVVLMEEDDDEEDLVMMTAEGEERPLEAIGSILPSPSKGKEGAKAKKRAAKSGDLSVALKKKPKKKKKKSKP